MSKKAELLAETTDSREICDVIGNTLRSLRITGTLLLNEDYMPPWAVSVPEATDLAELLDIPEDTRVAAFHLVRRGQIELRLQDGTDAVVQAGEMAVCFTGAAHQLSQGDPQQIVPFETIRSGAGRTFQSSAINSNRSTSLVCGVFLLQNTDLNPLFSALPPLLHTTVSRHNGLPTLSGVADLLVQEINRRTFGGDYITERLLELLCAETIRSHMETVPEQTTGWFRGLKDPVVGRTIAMIHANPGENWSVKSLAGHVAISPSRFAARFSRTVGESPVAYLTKWRMHVASTLLEDTQRSIDQIASNVGYESLPAFTRTFKRHLGLPPATWRRTSRRAR